LKPIAARVVREAENSVASQAEPSQIDFVCVAIVFGDDLVEDQVEFSGVSGIPPPYITALRANYQKRFGQRRTRLRVPCRRPVRGNTVGVFPGDRLPSAVEKA